MEHTTNGYTRLLCSAMLAMRRGDAYMADAYIGAAEIGQGPMTPAKARRAVAAVRGAYRYLDAYYATGLSEGRCDD